MKYILRKTRVMLSMLLLIFCFMNVSAEQTTIKTKLTELTDAYDSGIITKVEYDSMRKKILDSFGAVKKNQELTDSQRKALTGRWVVTQTFTKDSFYDVFKDYEDDLDYLPSDYHLQKRTEIINWILSFSGETPVLKEKSVMMLPAKNILTAKDFNSFADVPIKSYKIKSSESGDYLLMQSMIVRKSYMGEKETIEIQYAIKLIEGERTSGKFRIIKRTLNRNFGESVRVDEGSLKLIKEADDITVDGKEKSEIEEFFNEIQTNNNPRGTVQSPKQEDVLIDLKIEQLKQKLEAAKVSYNNHKKRNDNKPTAVVSSLLIASANLIQQYQNQIKQLQMKKHKSME